MAIAALEQRKILVRTNSIHYVVPRMRSIPRAIAVDTGCGVSRSVQILVKSQFASGFMGPARHSQSCQRGHFFHNPATPDKLRTRIFNGLTKTKPDFLLRSKLPKSSLERFYKLGMYLVPTIFHRIRDDAVPSESLIDHSSQTHLMAVLTFLANRQRLLKVILLGKTPSLAFVKAFAQHECGRQIAEALLRKKPVEEARKLTLSRPLSILIYNNSLLNVRLSKWPRGDGYHLLPLDILRALG
jgi:hypothetical protein